MKLEGSKYTLLFIISYFLTFLLVLLFKQDILESNPINYFVQVVSLALFFIYSLLIKYLEQYSLKDITPLNIMVVVFLIIFLPILLIISVLYYQTGDFFPYFGPDQLFYHEQALKYARFSQSEFINHFFNYERWWDIGTVYLVRSLYLIWESPIIVRLVNIIFITVTSYYIYRLSRLIMSKRYSLASVLLYSLSSYSLYFITASNKEPILVMVVVMALYYICSYSKTNRVKYLSVLVIPIFFLTFLRPYLIGLILISILLTYAMKRGISKDKLYVLFISTIGFIAVIPQLFIAYRRFFGSFEIFMLVNQDLFIHSLPVTLVFSLFVSLFGPLPTFFAFTPNEALAYYAPGLFFRNITAFLFLASAFLCIKKRETVILPIVFFTLLEIFALGLLLESFELRKALPHFPFIIILFVYLLFKINNNKISHRAKRLISKTNRLYVVLITILILIWNLRF